MADVTFNVAKGRAVHYGTLPAANDALIAVPLESAGLEADATLVDYADLAALLASTNSEQVMMGRKTLANVVVAVDNPNDRATIDCDDIVWTAATGSAVGALVICYDPDTTGGTDADLIPIAKYDFVATPGGTNITAQMAATGFYRAS